MIRISHWRETTAEQRPASEEKIQKSRTVKTTVWDASRKVNHLRSFEIITEFTRSTSSTRIGMPVLMMNVKVSKDKHIIKRVDGENLIYRR